MPTLDTEHRFTRHFDRRADGLTDVTIGADRALVGPAEVLAAYVLTAFEDREAARTMRAAIGSGRMPTFAYCISLARGAEILDVMYRTLGVCTAYTRVRTLEQREIAKSLGFDRVPSELDLFAR